MISHAIEILLAPEPKPRGKDDNSDGNSITTTLVGCHPSLDNKLAEEVLKRSLFK